MALIPRTLNAAPVLFPATHSGALTNAHGTQLGGALGINATQWHETPPQVVTAPSELGALPAPRLISVHPIFSPEPNDAHTLPIFSGNQHIPIGTFGGTTSGGSVFLPTLPFHRGDIHLPTALRAPVLMAPHPLSPTHVVVTGNPAYPLKTFDPFERRAL